MCIPSCNGTSSGNAAGSHSTAPCNGTTVPCPTGMVHARLRIKEVTFSGNHVINKDTLGNFSSPEWRHGRASADNSPVCYTRNSRVGITAKFDVVRRPSANETVAVRGQSTVGPATLQWNGSVTVNTSSSEVTVSGLSSNVNLPGQVACVDPCDIAWRYNPASSGWSSAGTSAHTLYVVLANPSGTRVYWTLVDISCRAAHGQTTRSALVSHTYGQFQGKALTRKRDGQGLTYWNPNTTTCTNTRLLLASSDGSGQCGSWAEFLIDMLKCHGITSAVKVYIGRSLPAGSIGFLVKNWLFTGAGTKPVPWPYILGTDCQQQPGVAGQRNANPPPAFYNHFIVQYGGSFYDPSYGSAPLATHSAWENGSIDGLFRDGSPSLAGYKKSSNTTTDLLSFYNARTGAVI